MAKYTPVWTPKDYTPFMLLEEKTHTDREIRAEYTRIRDIMMKRANRLEKAGLGTQATYIRQMMPKLKELGKDTTAVAQRLSQGHQLMQDRAYNLQGIKEIQKRVSDLIGDEISLGDVLPFDQFMRSWRMSAFKGIVPSEDAAYMHDLDDYQDLGGTFSDFYSLFLEIGQ